MRVITVQRVISAPVDQVFDWLADAGNMRRVPTCLSVRVQPGPGGPREVGTIRTVTTAALKVTEEITAVAAPERMEYRILSSIPPVRHDGGSVVLRPVGDGTEVTWSSTIEARTPLLTGLATALIATVMATGFRLTLRTADRELVANGS